MSSFHAQLCVGMESVKLTTADLTYLWKKKKKTRAEVKADRMMSR